MKTQGKKAVEPVRKVIPSVPFSAGYTPGQAGALRYHPCRGKGLRVNFQRKSKARSRSFGRLDFLNVANSTFMAAGMDVSAIQV